MATHSSFLTRRIPWTEEPGRLQSMQSQRVRHNWSNLAQTTGEVPSKLYFKIYADPDIVTDANRASLPILWRLSSWGNQTRCQYGRMGIFSAFFNIFQIEKEFSCNIELFPQRAVLCRVTPSKTNEEKKYLCNFTSKTAFQKLNKLENQCVFQL